MALTAETVDPEETLNVVAIVTAGGKEYRSNPTAVIVPADTVVDQTAAPTIDPITAGIPASAERLNQVQP